MLASALADDLKLDVGAHPRTAATPPSWPARPRATGSTWSSSSAATAPSTRSSTACSPTAPADVPDVPALAVVPGGSTNVFGRALGLPATRSRPPAPCWTRCASSRRRSIGLGLADDRWFTFCAGLGLGRRGGGPGRPAPRGPGRPARHTGTADYVRAALEQFFLHTDRRHAGDHPGAARRRAAAGCTWRSSATPRRGPTSATARCSPSPEASFDTGLDLFALTRLRTVGTLREVRRLLRGRPTPDRRGPRTLVHRQHDLAEFTLRAARRSPLQVDGDDLGERRVVTFRRRPNAL